VSGWGGKRVAVVQPKPSFAAFFEKAANRKPPQTGDVKYGSDGAEPAIVTSPIEIRLQTGSRSGTNTSDSVLSRITSAHPDPAYETELHLRNAASNGMISCE
jgi:hypothetical protein